jgi:phosphoglycolate phosphatase
MSDLVRAVLLDLDGTLSDSRPGIAASFRHMLLALGHNPDPADDLTWAVGPPIAVSVQQLLAQYGDDRVEHGLTLYRAQYSEAGLYNCTLYPGVFSMLGTLLTGNLTLCVATSKRRDFAERVVDHLGVRQFVQAVYGAEPGGGLEHKHDLLAHILAAEAFARSSTIMVGDRLHDVQAARQNGVTSIGVLWGYGSREELLAAGADALAEKPDTVAALIRNFAVTRQPCD